MTEPTNNPKCRDAQGRILEMVFKRKVRAWNRLQDLNLLSPDDASRDWKVGQAFGAWRDLDALWKNLKRRGLR